MTSYSSLWTSFFSDVPHTLGFVDANGVKTRYLQAGAPGNPRLLMLHGTAGSLENFSANIGPLSRHFECFAIDCLGSGLTDKPDCDYEIPDYQSHIYSVMDGLGIDKATFVGNSMGGWISASIAAHHPHRVERLILMSPSGLLQDPENSRLIQTQRAQAVNDTSWESMEFVIAQLIYKKEFRIPDLVGMRQKLYRNPEMKRAMQHIIAIQSDALRPRNVLSRQEWRSIKAKTLIVVGLKERQFYLDTADEIKKLVVDATVIHIPESGHWAMFEDAEIFNHQVIAFMNA